jgi:hypothetical protein
MNKIRAIFVTLVMGVILAIILSPSNFRQSNIALAGAITTSPCPTSTYQPYIYINGVPTPYGTPSWCGSGAGPNLSALATPTPMCIGGTTYQYAAGDEFTQDTPQTFAVTQLPQNQGTPAPFAHWSDIESSSFAGPGSPGTGTRAQAPGSNASEYVVHEDPTNPLPSWLNDGTVSVQPIQILGSPPNAYLSITPVRVPAAHATDPALNGDTWLSGVLQGPSTGYGFYTASMQIPNDQGEWPSFWLFTDQHGATGSGVSGSTNGTIQEEDITENFGWVYTNLGTQQSNLYYNSAVANQQTIQPVTNMKTQYHEYSLLRTSTGDSYFIDNANSSSLYPSGGSGLVTPIFDVATFSSTGFAPSPAPAANTLSPMNVTHYRYFQATSNTCGSSVVSAAPANHVYTPGPTATAAPSPGYSALVAAGYGDILGNVWSVNSSGQMVQSSGGNGQGVNAVNLPVNQYLNSSVILKYVAASGQVAALYSRDSIASGQQAQDGYYLWWDNGGYFHSSSGLYVGANTNCCGFGVNDFAHTTTTAPTAGSTYYMKLDTQQIAGGGTTLTGTIFSAAHAVLYTVTYTDTTSQFNDVFGLSGMSFFGGASVLGIYSYPSVQANSIVNTL